MMMFRRLGDLENVNSPLLFLDFIFKVVYSLRGVYLKSNRLSAQGFYKNLHCHNDGRKKDVESERDRSSIYIIGSVQRSADVIAVRGFYEAQAQKPGLFCFRTCNHFVLSVSWRAFREGPGGPLLSAK